MKKFGVAFLSLMLLCFAPLFVACGQTVEQIYRVKLVEFTEENIAMSVDAPAYQLEWEIEDNVALNQKVKFASSRPEVATVSETGLVTPVSTGVTVISIQSEDNPKAKTNTCTVRVLPLKQTLATPNDLKYVASTGQLTWEKVVENTAGDLIVSTSSFTPKYEITLKQQGQTETEVKVVSTNVYSDLVPGVAYEISVKALGNEYLYNDSVPTQSLNVHILDSPKNLKVTTNKQYAEVQTSTELYGTTQNPIASREFKLVFDLPSDNVPPANANIFDYYEISLLNDRGEEVTGDARGVLDELMTHAEILNTRFEMPISNFPAGDYFFRIKSISSTSNVYDSVYAQTKRVRILSSPTNLVLSGENKQILSWNSVSSAVGYQILIEYKTTTDDNESFKYSSFYVKSSQSSTFDLTPLKDQDGNKFLETEYTKFNIYLYALGNDANPTQTVVVDSVRSEDTARAQLSQVKNIRLAAPRASSENVELSWDPVMNVGSYKFEVYQNNNIVYSQNINTNAITIAKDAEWLVGGSYLIKLTAIPNTDQNYTKSIISDAFEITKLEKPLVSTLNGVLTWSAVAGVASDASYELHYVRQGTENVTVQISNGATAYDFGANVYNSGNYTDFYVVAKGNSNSTLSNTTIDSNRSTSQTITKLALPNKFSVIDGELNLNNVVGTAPNFVVYTTYLLKVVEESSNTIVSSTTLTTDSMQTTLKSIVSRLRKDVVYKFNLTALKTNNEQENVLYVKSNAVDTKVYLSETVEHLKAENGIVTFDMPQSLLNVIATSSNTNYVLDEDVLADVKFIVTNNINNTKKFVSAISDSQTKTLLTKAEIELENVSQEELSVGVQIIFENAEEPTICVLNSDVAYSQFQKITTPTITRLYEDGNGKRMLAWSKTNVNDGLKYEFKIKFDNDETTKTFVSPCSEIDESNEGFNQIDITNLITGDISEGTYTITLKIHPITQTTYLSSNTSAEFTFKKLVKPEITIANNLISWSTSETLSTLRYKLSINGGIPLELNSTSYDLSDHYGVLNLQVQAVSNIDNILSSDSCDQVVVVKLNSSEITVAANGVGANSIVWRFSNTFNISGQDVDLEPKKFAYKVYYDTNQNSPLASGQIEGSDGNFAYIMPQNTTYREGFYTLVVTPLGDSVELGQNGIAGVVDGNPYYFHIYKMSQINDLVVNEEKISFGKVEPSTGLTGIETQYSIYVSSLDSYVYIAKTQDDLSAAQEITFDSSAGTKYSYKVKLDANDKYVIPIQKITYTTSGTEITADDGGLIQNLLTSSQANYVSQGTTFNIRVNTNVSERTALKEGQTYYVFDSNAALLRNITLLDAPTIRFSDGIMTWTTAKTNFEKLQFNFKKYVWSNTSSRTLDDPVVAETKTIEYFGSNSQRYDLSQLFDDNPDDTTTYYRLSIQSIGNQTSTISSKLVELEYVIGNLARVKINTQSTAENADGWYVKDGAITWNKVDGVRYYVIKFEQLRQESLDKVVATQEIVYQNTGPAQNIYQYIPGSDFQLSGFYLVSMRLIGDVYNDGHEYAAAHSFTLSANDAVVRPVYANSRYYTTSVGVQRLCQLDTNNTMRVENGELAWTNNQSTVVTSYSLFVEDSGTQVLTKSVANPDSSVETLGIVFSEESKPTSLYDISLKAIGQTWVGRNVSLDNNVVYLTSKESSYFRFRFVNANDINLAVTKGLFNWSIDNTLGTSTWNPTYQVGVSTDGTNFTWLATQQTKSNELTTYADQAIAKLVVRIIGDAASTSNPLLNSAITDPLTNLKKLPNLAQFNDGVGTYETEIIINQIGDLVWNCGYDNAYEGLFDTQVSVTVRDGKTNAVMGQPITQTLDKQTTSLKSPVVYNYEDNGVYIGVSPIYEFGISVVGSVNYNGGGLTYISSNPSSISARKFGNISNFTLRDGVNFVWDTEKACIITYDETTSQNIKELPTKYIVEYKALTDESFTRIVFDAQYQENSTVNLYKTLAQFIDNGTYLIKMSVYKNNQSFRSTPIYCTIDLNDEISLTNIYDGLTYDVSDGKPYFLIGSEEAVQNVNYTLGSNILVKNVATPTQSIIGTSEVINLYDIAVGANYRMTADIAITSLDEDMDLADNLHNQSLDVGEETFKLLGIFDGANRKISNIQTLNSGKLAWFDSIAHTGIIKDITLSYSSIDLSCLGWTYNSGDDDLSFPTEFTYFGFIANKNYGIIQNCKLLAENSDPQEDVVKNFFDETDNIILGMIVGQNLTTSIRVDDETTIIKKSKVVGCENSISLPLSGELSYTMAETKIYQTINVGGIVAENNGGYVVNCVNKGNLKAYRVGGIAYQNMNGGIISGCENSGTIVVQTAKSNSDPTIAGGIVALNFDANIVYCLNRGMIEARTETNIEAYNYVNLGGIVGQITNASGKQSIIANCLQTYDDEVGLHVLDQYGGVWPTINIGYLFGDITGQGTTIVEDCAYKTSNIPQKSGESPSAYSARLINDVIYYANLVCGSLMHSAQEAAYVQGETYEEYVARLKQLNVQEYPSVVSLDSTENAIATLNVNSTNGSTVVCIENDAKPVFVSQPTSISLILVDINSEYSQLLTSGSQSATLATNPGFVPTLNDNSAFNLTNITVKSVQYEVGNAGATQLSTTIPTTAGTYNVYVTYTLNNTFADVESDVVFKYTYELTQ